MTRSTPGAGCSSTGRPGDHGAQTIGTIEIPGSARSSFDHGAFDPKTRRVFVAHTGRDRVEVIDHDGHRHLATLPGFPEAAAGVVADDGIVLVTNRGAASLAWSMPRAGDAGGVQVGPEAQRRRDRVPAQFAIAACIGDDAHGPELQVFELADRAAHYARAAGPAALVRDGCRRHERVFLAIREPSMVLIARLPDLPTWSTGSCPPGGAHGLDIDHQRGRTLRGVRRRRAGGARQPLAARPRRSGRSPARRT